MKLFLYFAFSTSFRHLLHSSLAVLFFVSRTLLKYICIYFSSDRQNFQLEIAKRVHLAFLRQFPFYSLMFFFFYCWFIAYTLRGKPPVSWSLSVSFVRFFSSFFLLLPLRPSNLFVVGRFVQFLFSLLLSLYNNKSSSSLTLKWWAVRHALEIIFNWLSFIKCYGKKNTLD